MEIAPRCPLDRRLGGLQSRFGSCGVEKNLVLENKTQLTSLQPVAIPTEI
jgi:hypothetical protein